MNRESSKGAAPKPNGQTRVLSPLNGHDPSLTSLGFRYEADLAREEESRSASIESALTGRRFGPYELGEQLGTGVLGTVYRAHDANLRHEVVLEIVSSELCADRELLLRLEREVGILASLGHSNVGAIYGVEQHGGVHAVVLELVDGTTLAARLSSGSALSAEEALEVARQIAGALDAAHGKGLVHRNLKPASVRINGEGVVKVLDFGLAGRAGGIAAASIYVAPEQALGREGDRRADVWSLGLLIYEMFTGRLPFEGGAPATLGALTAALAALPKRVQPELTPLLARALAIDIADRYQSMSELIADLDKARERIGTNASRVMTPWARGRFGTMTPADNEGQAVATPEPLSDTDVPDDSSLPAEPDFTASDALTEIRTSQRRLREYRAKALQLTDVEEVVSRKVLADYDARYQELERKAAPLVHKVRHEHHRLQRSVAQVRRTDEDARLLKAEADLRHAVGEIDETELAERVREPNETRARCEERLATFEAVEARFLAALETGAESST